MVFIFKQIKLEDLLRLGSFSERSGTTCVRQMQGGCARPGLVLFKDVPFNLIYGG